MEHPKRTFPAAVVVVAGLVGLAAAMGIGRFAFTPLLPLMQGEFGLSLAQGAWLASVNYLGYLLGAIISFAAAPRPRDAARWGLLLVALTTLAMVWTTSYAAWAVLRLVAGAASAFALVGVSGWTLARLTAAGRGELAGGVFAGVGIGMVLAGLVTLGVGAIGQGSKAAWLVLGVIAAGIAVLTWRPFAAPEPALRAPAITTTPRLDASAWVLVVSYGIFGLGYIVTATFLPAIARSVVADPAVFGWAWPLFGGAAAASTVAVTKLWPRASPRSVAAVAQCVMAAGVLAPALHMSLATIVISALCVGGTFMVVTMAGLQEARRISSGSPTRLMSGMTAAFAIGQLAGPVLVGAGSTAAAAIVGPSLVAAALLIVSALALVLGPTPRAIPAPT